MKKIYVGNAREIKKNKPKKVKISTFEEAVVFKNGSTFVAVKNRCPHAGASLHDAQISGNTLTCIWHGWKFDLESGEGLTEKWAKLKKLEIVTEAEELYLLLPDD